MARTVEIVQDSYTTDVFMSKKVIVMCRFLRIDKLLKRKVRITHFYFIVA